MTDRDLLTSLRSELDGLDTTLGDLIEKAERALAKLRLGVPISVKLGDDVLWFDKHNKAWRLIVVHEDGSHTMLCDSPRDVRALAMQTLPALLASAPAQMREMIKERKRVIEQTQAIIETMKEGK